MIHRRFGEKDDLANLKSDVNRLDIDKLEKLPSGLNSLKSKAEKLGVDILQTFTVQLKKIKWCSW